MIQPQKGLTLGMTRKLVTLEKLGKMVTLGKLGKTQLRNSAIQEHS